MADGHADGVFFRIALLADVQYADKPDRDIGGAVRYYRTSLSRLRSAVNQLNHHEQLTAVIHLGDIVDGNVSEAASLADFSAVVRLFRRIRHPVFHVVGNHCHDVGRPTLLRELGRPYYSETLAPGWCVAVLDTTDLGVNGASEELIKEGREWLDANAELEHANEWNGGVGKAQLHWLHTQLKQARQRGEHTIVVGHMPMMAAASSAMHLTFNHAEVCALLDEFCDVCPLYICGHCHHGGYARSAAGVHHVTVEGIVEMPPGAERSHAVLTVSQAEIVIDGGGGGVLSRTLRF
jgi:DNA repair exonuclease SbcCD nuclease subunit